MCAAGIAAKAIRVVICALICLSAVTRAADPLEWPAQTREHRPWAYWWWMASAVDRTNLTRELERYRAAGYGGVHIIPIYGARGFEDRYIPYLSSRWMEMLAYTVAEADRLDMGVDMTTGSGWCFGGPNVRDHEANALMQVKQFDVAAGTKLHQRLDPKMVQAVVAYPQNREAVEVTSRLNPDGALDWVAEAVPHTVYVVSQRPSGQKVKRAAPGGEGHMLNLIYPQGVAHFLERYTDAFNAHKGPKPRAQYHDSYEYRSDWAPDMFAQFEKRRGYRLQNHLPSLLENPPGDKAKRVKCDYRESVSDIMVEESFPLWNDWARKHGFITRNEAHGAPANLLDLYALSDVPETEMFHKDRSKLISKFASSASHVAGRKLVGCETGTWLKEHFTETLADVKHLVDDLFVSGVNHVFYHGTCYSPDDAVWPGWLFYASTEMNPRNSIWRDALTLNAYIARCQSVLQSGAPDNDVLLYWPIHDFWQSGGGMVQHMTVHARNWFEEQAIGKTAEQLWNKGIGFDYVSDRQLTRAQATDGKLRMPGGTFRAVVVPKCESMPLPTFKKLLDFASKGVPVIFESDLPKDVPGFAKLNERRGEFRTLQRGASRSPDKAALKIGDDVVALLRSAGIERESLVDHAGLWFIRRSFEDGRHYFIANRGEQALKGWVKLATPLQSAALLDPLTGHAGVARSQGEREVFLQLEPGASIIVRTFTKAKASGAPWHYHFAEGEPVEVKGTWDVAFVRGGPELPPPAKMTKLESWTTLGGPAESFAGTARYRIEFDAPRGDAQKWQVDLGSVCHSARVRLNGRDLGTLIVAPYRVVADELKQRGNILEIEVTNLSANRIRDLDRRGVKWRNFHDINFVNIDYKPFDASNWPLAESGLLGPVTLRPLRAQ